MHTPIEVTNQTLSLFKKALQIQTEKHIMSLPKDAIGNSARQFTQLKLMFVKNYEHLGSYFDEGKFIILDSSLAFFDMDVAMGIYLHEIAHFVDEKLFPAGQIHGVSFRRIAEAIGGFPKATVDTYSKNIKAMENDSDSIVGKVKKLFSLASSSNLNEAELATAKANQLIQKYSLRFTDGTESLDNETDFYRVSLAQFNRTPYKYFYIQKILDKFGVYSTSYKQSLGYNKNGSRKKSISTLQISGTKANVEVAKYVFDFLDVVMENLYSKYVKTLNGNIGDGSKANFMEGFYYEFIKKVSSETKGTPEEQEVTESALELFNEEICDLAKKNYYSNCSWSRGSGIRYQSNSGAYSAGSKAGARTNINPGVRNSSGPKYLS